MAKVTVSIEIDNIDKIIKEKDALVEKAMIECGLKMERYAIYGCPVKTGRLRNSITYATETFHSSGNSQPGEKAPAEDMKLRGTPDKGSVTIGTNTEYAPYVELGSSRRSKVPFLKPSLQGHESEYKEIIEKTLGNG